MFLMILNNEFCCPFRVLESSETCKSKISKILSKIVFYKIGTLGPHISKTVTDRAKIATFFDELQEYRKHVLKKLYSKVHRSNSSGLEVSDAKVD